MAQDKKTFLFIPHSILKIFGWLVFVFLILGASEIIYIYNNQPTLSSGFFLYLARHYAIKNEITKSLDFLEKASLYQINFKEKSYPDLIPEKYNLSISPADKNSQFNQEYISYIKGLNTNDIFEQKEVDVGRIIYHLSLLAYRGGEEELTPALLQTAVYIKPNLVHYHLELANYYLYIGDAQKAKEAIEFCYSFDFPRSFCENFYQNNISTNTPDNIGFLEDALKTDYQTFDY